MSRTLRVSSVLIIRKKLLPNKYDESNDVVYHRAYLYVVNACQQVHFYFSFELSESSRFQFIAYKTNNLLLKKLNSSYWFIVVNHNFNFRPQKDTHTNYRIDCNNCMYNDWYPN